jgi:hypothetical protein
MLARPALAEDSAKAAAVSAFDEARRLIEKKQIAEACAKFGESQRLDPQLGTLLHWADCLERNGQTASAWARFRDASELAATRNDRRQTLAEDRAAKLEPRLSRLRIEVDHKNELKGLQITRDGVVLGQALWDSASPVDPGTYSVEVSGQGRKPWTRSVVVPSDGSTVTVRVPVLEQDESSKALQASPGRTEAETTTPPVSSDSSWISGHWPVAVAAGVGLVGVGVGSVFGLRSKKFHDQAEDYCEGQRCTDQRGVDLKDDAIQAGTISTIAFAAGGAALATAGVLWIVAPRKVGSNLETAVLVGPGAISVRGAF